MQKKEKYINAEMTPHAVPQLDLEFLAIILDWDAVSAKKHNNPPINIPLIQPKCSRRGKTQANATAISTAGNMNGNRLYIIKSIIMKIVNGRWVDNNEQPVDHFNVSELLEIGDNVRKMYGEDITYSRISLVSAIKSLTPEQEDSLAYILSNDVLMSKLAGF